MANTGNLTARPVNKNKILKYGLKWDRTVHPASAELTMISHGGRWRNKRTGEMVGEGLAYHFKQVIRHLWPEIIQHRWTDIQIDNWVKYRSIVVLGPKSTGKTCITGAICHLIDYYAFPDTTTTICTSTTKEQLEDRVWSEVKKMHKLAKARCPWLPGHLIDGRQRLVTDGRDTIETGRDFRSGMVGVPAYKGTATDVISAFVGRKNKRVRLLLDELSLLPPAIIGALSNLDANVDFKVTGLGNPKDTIDALGILAEPANHLGGWDGGIDQTGGTKVWETRRPDGVCIQLVGSDSPNLDGSLGIPLITQEQINRDIAFYGKDSLWFTMMNEGRMPRGQGNRRVLTRQMCQKFGAMKQPVWNNENRTLVACLDAAYRGVGGDRCMFAIMEFGDEAPEPVVKTNEDGSLVIQNPESPELRQIIAVNELKLVPVDNGLTDLPEDQIVHFVMAECKARNIPPENFFYDAGMRTSLVTAFSRLWSPSVNSIDFGGLPTEDHVSNDITVSCRNYYSKFVTQLWFSVRLAVESGQWRSMPEGALSEFCSREWTMVAGNKIEVEPKKRMKEKVGRSPDEADTLVCGLYGAMKLGFRIAKFKNQQSEDEYETEQWKRDLREKARKSWNKGRLDYAA